MFFGGFITDLLCHLINFKIAVCISYGYSI